MTRCERAALSRGEEESADSESCPQSSGAVVLPDGAAKDAAHGRCRVWALVLVSAVAVAAACLPIVAAADYFNESAAAVEDVVSAQSAGALFAVGKGCQNWKVSAIGRPTVVADADACGSLCSGTVGCIEYNFQTKEKSQCPQGGMEKGECYLFSDECMQEDNACWDLYKMPAPAQLPWYLRASRHICKDWKTNSIGNTWTVELNANTCGKRCLQTAGCKLFNFQPGPCTGQLDSIEQGACILYSDICTAQDDVCTDLYGMREGVTTPSTSASGTTQSTTPSTTPTTFDGMATLRVEVSAGATELALNEQPIQFKVGNVVQIGAGMAFESGEIGAINQGSGTITLVKPLKFDYPVGTPVQFRQAVFDTKVTANAEQGTRKVSIADAANYRPDDAVSIGDPPAGPYIANRIQSVNYNTSTVTLEFSLSDPVRKGTSFKKIATMSTA